MCFEAHEKKQQKERLFAFHCNFTPSLAIIYHIRFTLVSSSFRIHAFISEYYPLL